MNEGNLYTAFPLNLILLIKEKRLSLAEDHKGGKRSWIRNVLKN
jgi:hypothetical protein